MTGVVKAKEIQVYGNKIGVKPVIKFSFFYLNFNYLFILVAFYLMNLNRIKYVLSK